MRLSRRLRRVERAAPPPPAPLPAGPNADDEAVCVALCAIASGDERDADRLGGETRRVVEDMRSVASAVKTLCEHLDRTDGGVGDSV